LPSIAQSALRSGSRVSRALPFTRSVSVMPGTMKSSPIPGRSTRF
jgi:hypothetical protein